MKITLTLRSRKVLISLDLMNTNDTDGLCNCQQPKLCRQSRTQWTRERCATPLFGGGSNVADVGAIGDADVGGVGDIG